MLVTYKNNYPSFFRCNLSSWAGCVCFIRFCHIAIAVSRAHRFRQFSLDFSVTFRDKNCVIKAKIVLIDGHFSTCKIPQKRGYTKITRKRTYSVARLEILRPAENFESHSLAYWSVGLFYNTTVGAFLWWARQLGIRCQIVFVTQNWVSILSNISWRHTFLRNIDDKMY